MTVGFKQGDLEPPLVIDITGEGADLNGVETWRVIGRRRGSADLVIDAANIPEVDPEDPSKAVVTHHWEPPETDTLGVLLIEVEAEWPGGRKQTFPSTGYVQVRITDDLG